MGTDKSRIGGTFVKWLKMAGNLPANSFAIVAPVTAPAVYDEICMQLGEVSAKKVFVKDGNIAHTSLASFPTTSDLKVVIVDEIHFATQNVSKKDGTQC